MDPFETGSPAGERVLEFLTQEFFRIGADLIGSSDLLKNPDAEAAFRSRIPGMMGIAGARAAERIRSVQR